MFEYSFDYSDDVKTLNISYATQADIDAIVFPADVDTVMVSYSRIERIRIPEGVTSCLLSRIGLQELYIPDSVEYLYCSNNFLTALELPADIIVVEANFNHLQSVVFRKPPTAIARLLLNENWLSELEFDPPESLEVLNIRFNNLGTMSPKLTLVLDNDLSNGDYANM